MLLVKSTGQPRAAKIWGDAYTPLVVNWAPVGSVRPIYYRVQSPGGGDIELQIEPLKGEVIGVTVIEDPALKVKMPDPTYVASRTDEGAVFVDREPWSLNPDCVPTREVIYEESQLSWAEDRKNLYFSLSDTEPDRFILAGQAGFGIAEPNLLVGIISEKPSLDG
jgi:hypothetical protein